MATIHKFGVRIDGTLHTLSGSVNDDEFLEVTANGLPDGWVAWHVDDSECDPPSERVLGIRALPALAIRWQDAMADAVAKRPIGTTGYAVSVV